MIIGFKNDFPNIHDSCYVAERATVIGKVNLKRNANVWFGAVIRGDVNTITIGENTNIQDNCTIHVNSNMDTAIGDDVTIGHNAVVHACSIGNNVLIGMGSIILDGAVIGDHVIIGAGSLIPPRKVIPPNTLVMGLPAKVVRQLTEEEKENIKKSALEYIGLASNYKNK